MRGDTYVRHVGTQKVARDHELDTAEQSSFCVSVWAWDGERREKEEFRWCRYGCGAVHLCPGNEHKQKGGAGDT